VKIDKARDSFPLPLPFATCSTNSLILSLVVCAEDSYGDVQKIHVTVDIFGPHIGGRRDNKALPFYGRLDRKGKQFIYFDGKRYLAFPSNIYDLTLRLGLRLRKREPVRKTGIHLSIPYIYCR
jgi:hypothetical protein